MRAQIHPKYYPEAKVVCACGNSWVTGSTKPEIHVDICSNCHPFYTGEQRIIDTEGQVDRFYKRLEVRTEYKKKKDAKKEAQTSPDRLLAAFDITKKTLEAYKTAGIENAGQFLEKLSAGDEAVLAIEGVGRKGLADTKRALKRAGFSLPEGSTAETEESAS